MQAFYLTLKKALKLSFTIPQRSRSLYKFLKDIFHPTSNDNITKENRGWKKNRQKICAIKVSPKVHSFNDKNVTNDLTQKRVRALLITYAPKNSKVIIFSVKVLLESSRRTGTRKSRKRVNEFLLNTGKIKRNITSTTCERGFFDGCQKPFVNEVWRRKKIIKGKIGESLPKLSREMNFFLLISADSFVDFHQSPCLLGINYYHSRLAMKYCS